jgi:ribonuclease HII
MNFLKQSDIAFKQKKKCDFLCAFDEVGRGSLAGPFVAACVILPDSYYNEKITDSKKLSENLITKLAEEIKENSLYYDIIVFSPKEIDEMGIQQVNIKAFELLKLKAEQQFPDCVCLVDGNIMNDKIGFWSLVKGDSNSFSIACASIIAKDFRDSYMTNISSQYPKWNLEKNKGYGQDYVELCKKHGHPDIHRKSYKIKDEKQIKFF